MERTKFIVRGPRSARDTFSEIAKREGFGNEETPLLALGIPQNTAHELLLILKEGGGYAGGAYLLSKVIIAWIKGRSERKVTLTLLEDNRIKALDAQNYSPKELEEIVKNCREVLLYEPREKD